LFALRSQPFVAYLRGIETIFDAARKAGAVVITKDSDFVELVRRFGSPPKVIWITCGNTSNARLRQIFQAKFATAIALLEQGESVVEISDAPA
jgi:predicted nuclease of predicted toxin-antitoxin system